MYTNGSEVTGYGYDAKGNIYGGYGILRNYNYQNLPLEIFNMNNETYRYTYNNNGERIRKVNADTDEGDYYLRDYLGKELVIYNNLTDEPKSANIFGNGLVGKIEIDNNADNRSYYLKDHLGNVRCVISAEGNVQSAQDYYPYGETFRNYSNNKYLFTEKERDTESTYDYFGARYYDSNIGMWLQVDPLAEKYPGWSSYNYCLNNSLKLIDPDGEWPKEIHDYFIEKAFSTFSNRTLEILKAASSFADTDQSTENSFKHAMRFEGQTPEEAEKLYNNFLEQQIDKYVNAKSDEDAHFQLGLGLHAVMDATSPSHKGFRIWRGIFSNNIYETGYFMGQALAHYDKENDTPTKTQTEETIKKMLEYLKKAEKRYEEKLNEKAE